MLLFLLFIIFLNKKNKKKKNKRFNVNLKKKKLKSDMTSCFGQDETITPEGGRGPNYSVNNIICSRKKRIKASLINYTKIHSNKIKNISLIFLKWSYFKKWRV